ncbi:hypothetical protein AQI95_26890 [Streptomyces yokosukanensis]|uniref:Uncharacterized protein n=1 Tax=Streptomyces yokosukanensis TaxID=67386 RepID=A0A101P024_9ACTN|nr:hypothetical protein [Streptomyces yokosukanensis]KUN02448.1 hypothetical protein AQI95_26890 [Streptomyces yokosukanensis]
MHVDWSALGKVAAVSLGVTVAVVVVFTFGVLGLSRAEAGNSGSAAGRSQAALCFLACAAVVAYGIYLIVPQFH